MKKILLLTVCAAGLMFAAVDGKTTYETKCASCHGLKGELKPLDKNHIIRGMSERKIFEELTEMKSKNKTFYFFKKNKAMMIEAAKGLSDEEIKALAKYIPNL